MSMTSPALVWLVHEIALLTAGMTQARTITTASTNNAGPNERLSSPSQRRSTGTHPVSAAEADGDSVIAYGVSPAGPANWLLAWRLLRRGGAGPAGAGGRRPGGPQLAGS